MNLKLCPVCKNEFQGGEIFCPNDGARLSTPSQFTIPSTGEPSDPLVGQTVLGRYKVLRRIGEGGMGIVYEAEHTTLEKRVALKVLRDDYSSRSEVVERFRQEAKSASRIGNAHIVDISDFGELPNGASFFVMELLEGEDLANVLSREGVLGAPRAANILAQCCKALAAAHAKGIVHRDMKPENIFLTTRDGEADFVKIVDFGIAKMSDVETPGAPGRKLTKTGMIFGTPEYMSPEQAAGKSLDHRVDIYALGVIMFEMLAGKVPFVGDTFMGILTQHMFEPTPDIGQINPNVDVTPAVQSFLHKAMAKAPEDRFQSCDEMHKALDRALRGEPTEPVPLSGRTIYGHGVDARRAAGGLSTTTPTSTGSFATAEAPPRRGAPVALIAVVVLALAAGGGYFAFASGMLGGTGTSTLATAPTAIPDGGPPTVEPPPSSPDTGPPSVPDAGSDSGGPRRVTLTIQTDPAGARVTIEGRGEVCETTPCTVEVPVGQEIEIRASLRRARGSTHVIPLEGMEPITIRLTARPPSDDEGGSSGSGSGSGSSGSGSSSGGSGGDLKIPDIFSRPRTH